MAIRVALPVARGQCPELVAAAAGDCRVQPHLSLGTGFHSGSALKNLAGQLVKTSC